MRYRFEYAADTSVNAVIVGRLEVESLFGTGQEPDDVFLIWHIPKNYDAKTAGIKRALKARERNQNKNNSQNADQL